MVYTRQRKDMVLNMKKIKYVAVCVLTVCMLFGMSGLSGCGRDGSGTRVVFTRGFDKDEVFRIGSESCRKRELMVYLTNIQNQYEQVYGKEIWNVTLDGVTMEDNVKETVLARIAQIKTMYLLAKERETELSETEQKNVEAAAREYFASLGEAEIKEMDVSLETMEKMYREYALADKVYHQIIQDVNPEISDDEARTITVQHILIRTYSTDGAGNRVAYRQRKNHCRRHGYIKNRTGNIVVAVLYRISGCNAVQQYNHGKYQNRQKRRC